MATPTGPEILKLSYVGMGTRQVPPPEAQLWRFMDLAKLVSMLIKGSSRGQAFCRETGNVGQVQVLKGVVVGDVRNAESRLAG
jgi:hypothetical protein